jgi:hypothetical protein
VCPPSVGPEPTSGLEPETCCLRNNRRTVQGRSPRFNYATIAPILLPKCSWAFARARGRWGIRWGTSELLSILVGSDPALIGTVLSPRMGSSEAITTAGTGARAWHRSGTCSCLPPLVRSPPRPIRVALARVAVMVLVMTQLPSGW